jgi:hypothetical protein
MAAAILEHERSCRLFAGRMTVAAKGAENLLPLLRTATAGHDKTAVQARTKMP